MKMGDGQGEHSVNIKNFKGRKGRKCQTNVASLKRVPQVCFHWKRSGCLGHLKNKGRMVNLFQRVVL